VLTKRAWSETKTAPMVYNALALLLTVELVGLEGPFNVKVGFAEVQH